MTATFVDPGEGDDTVSIGIGGHVAASHGADVINLDLSDVTQDSALTAFDFSDQDDQMHIVLPESGGQIMELTVNEGVGGGSSYTDSGYTYLIQFNESFEGEITPEMANAIGLEFVGLRPAGDAVPEFNVIGRFDLGAEDGFLTDDGTYGTYGDFNRSPDITYQGELAAQFQVSP